MARDAIPPGEDIRNVEILAQVSEKVPHRFSTTRLGRSWATHRAHDEIPTRDGVEIFDLCYLEAQEGDNFTVKTMAKVFGRVSAYTRSPDHGSMRSCAWSKSRRCG